MNERDYYIFFQVCLFTGVISLLLGGFILQILGNLTYINTLFLIFIFFVFFILAVYFFNEKEKLEKEYLEEFKKYLNGVNNDDDGTEI